MKIPNFIHYGRDMGLITPNRLGLYDGQMYLVTKVNTNIWKTTSSIEKSEFGQLLLVDFSYNSANCAAVKNCTPENVFM